MDAVLVGLVLPEVENHSLAVLREACGRAGFEARIVPFSGFVDLYAAVRRIEELRPRLVGISIQTTEASLSALTLARVLRTRGFAGRMVAGGHFATLNADAIVESPAGIDAVVRFAGDRALVELLREPDDLACVPGIVFRSETGKALRGAAPEPQRHGVLVPPPRERVGSHLGFGSVDLVTSRGCEHHCAYCCVATAGKELVREAAEQGRVEQRFEKRSVTEVAEEMAALFHEHGVRVFNFMDDNLLPAEPRDAAEMARSLAAELEVRKVRDIGFSLQLRADAVSEDSAAALADLGLARAYVGVDGYSAKQLRVLGRRADADAGARAVRLLADRGVFVVCNALLLGPTIATDSIQEELFAISRIRRSPVHLLPIDAREGTPYAERAAARGLVEGAFFWRRYRFADSRTERVARVLLSMPTRLALRSVPIALYDLGYNLGIARRLMSDVAIDDLAREYEAVADAWNADQLRLLALALGACTSDDAIELLVENERDRVRAHDEALVVRADDALDELERRVRNARGPEVRVRARGKLISAAAASFTMLAACSAESVALDSGTGMRIDAGPPRDADAADVGAPDAAASDAGTDAGCAPGCAEPLCAADLPLSADCPPDFCDMGFTLSIDSGGVVTDVAMADGAPLDPSVRECLVALFAPYCYPASPGTTQHVESHCWIA